MAFRQRVCFLKISSAHAVPRFPLKTYFGISAPSYILGPLFVRYKYSSIESELTGQSGTDSQGDSQLSSHDGPFTMSNRPRYNTFY